MCRAFFSFSSAALTSMVLKEFMDVIFLRPEFFSITEPQAEIAK